ncbi:MAG: pyridoxal-5'-phosphate-dependent protein subunit beta [Pseudomonadota bacterium]
MAKLGLETHIVDPTVYDRVIQRFREAKIALPTFAQLADPKTIPSKVRSALANVDPNSPNSLNLFRVHWFNSANQKEIVDVPEHIVLPPSLTGVKAQIVVMIGAHFPMISAHKVLAAYGCLVPRLVTGQFDPVAHKAIWPSTGNYCRGGVAISRITGCRGVAILPEGMSQERFNWLDKWVSHPDDVIKTYGTESNVKEIYDKCNELDRDPKNVIFNQFCEFGNHLVHYLCTGKAAETVFKAQQAKNRDSRLRAFVSCSGSAGTIAAGDYLKEKFGSLIVGSEAVECPTMLYNGFGEHNIQGIGDKHIPYIHNVMNMDVAVGITDKATDTLDVLFNTEAGREYLTQRKGVPAEIVNRLSLLGFSSICNILSAIKTAKYYQMNARDVVVTVATDSAAMYGTEREKALKKYFPKGFDTVEAAETYGRHMAGTQIDHLRELSFHERHRIFNLGYYTWVEQQGVTVEEFNARRKPEFWTELQTRIAAWDKMTEEFNKKTGALDRIG